MACQLSRLRAPGQPEVMKIHLDTDIGSDIDDVCALAMLLGWPGVELTGVTTTIDPGGRRAGYVVQCLRMANRGEVAVAAGAEVSLTTFTMPGDIPADDRYWRATVAPRPGSAGAAFDLLERSIEQGATIVAVGPYTNLALFEAVRPGRLARVPVVVMGGWVTRPDHGLPPWGPERDWNVGCDTRAAETLLRATGALTLVTLAATAKVHLRASHLERLEASGPLGQLVAHQARAYGEDHQMEVFGRRYRALPDDLLNFQHDPLACAVAAGWDGVRTEDLGLEPAYDGNTLRFVPHPAGRPVRVVTDADGETFAGVWLGAIEAAGERRH
jgi:purine nucleosidase